jgi:hypothetical protein
MTDVLASWNDGAGPRPNLLADHRPRVAPVARVLREALQALLVGAQRRASQTLRTRHSAPPTVLGVPSAVHAGALASTTATGGRVDVRLRSLRNSRAVLGLAGCQP